jgi:glutaredoxin
MTSKPYSLLSTINNNNWFIVTKKGCPYCDKAKMLLKSHHLDYGEYEITRQTSTNINDELSKFTDGYKYFPKIFKNGNFIGGYSELLKLETKVQKIPISNLKKQFKGLPWDMLAGLIYLSLRFPNNCIVIPQTISLERDIYSLRDMKEISLRWIQTNGKNGYIHIPPGYWDSLKKCKQPRFIMLPFGFSCATGVGHTNFLVYDTRTKEMERFEPHGKLDSKITCVNPNNIDERIKGIFNTNLGSNFIRRIYSPLEFCPEKCFQDIQVRENKRAKSDPRGFCVAWCIWYAEMRMKHPNMSRNAVVKKATNDISNNSGFKSYTSFIRAYSNFLLCLRKELVKSRKPENKLKYILGICNKCV